MTDVQEMRDLLVARYGFPTKNVDTLTNDRATRDNIIAAIQQRLSRAGPDGTALLYYSGHGVPLDSNYSVQDVESSGVDQGLLVWSPGRSASIVLDDELGALLRRLPAGRVVVILDACFSGSGAKFFPGTANGVARPRFVNKSVSYASGDPGFTIPTRFFSDGEAATEASRDGRYALLAASSDTARAFGVKDWPQPGESHGVFTYFLTRALRDDSGLLTPRQLRQQLGSQARNATPCAADSACQDIQVLGAQIDVPLRNLLGTRP